MPVSYLYRAEVKGIQEWILASHRLQEIKGGSGIVDGLAGLADNLASHIGATVLTNAAGNVELRLQSAEAAERFSAAWPLAVARVAPGLQVIQAAALEQSEGWPVVFHRLGAARNLPDAVLPEVGPLVARSGRTGLPAVRREAEELQDAAVEAKLAHTPRGGAVRLEALAPPGRKFVIDADQLGERYLALVHADGNGLGERFMKSGDRRNQASQAISDACWSAAEKAVKDLDEQIRRAARVGIDFPARPIVVAGDDFTFLVDAEYALHFTAKYLRAFEEEGQRLNPFDDGQPITACAGIAIVKTGFPFHAAHDLAESLCKAAKDRLRAGNTSGLLFHRVTTASTDLSWRDIRDRELSAAPLGEGNAAWLSAGPYTLEELHRLQAVANAMRDLPRGAMREWVSLSRVQRSRADALWDRTKEIASAGKALWNQFDEALKAFSEARFGAQVPLARGWATWNNAEWTPIADALYLRGSSAEAPAHRA